MTSLTLVQTEAQFQSKIVELARLYGYLIYHTWNSKNSAKGFPDLVLCRPGRAGAAGELVFMELKTESGKVSADQESWFKGLDSVPGVTAGIYRPSDMALVEKMLRGSR